MRLDEPQNNLILVGRSIEKLNILSKNIKTSNQIIHIDLTEVEKIKDLFNNFSCKITGFVHAAGNESVSPLKLVNYKKDYLGMVIK